MHYLIDTDWIIEALNGKPNATRVFKEIPPEDIGICWASIGEVYEGAFGRSHPSEHIASFKKFLLPFKTLDLNDEIMEQFAKIRFDLRKKGAIISDFDILIAATAIHYKLTILTFNAKHFSRIKGVKLYKNITHVIPPLSGGIQNVIKKII